MLEPLIAVPHTKEETMEQYEERESRKNPDGWAPQASNPQGILKPAPDAAEEPMLDADEEPAHDVAEEPVPDAYDEPETIHTEGKPQGQALAEELVEEHSHEVEHTEVHTSECPTSGQELPPGDL